MWRGGHHGLRWIVAADGAKPIIDPAAPVLAARIGSDVSVACDPGFTTINGLRALLNPVLIVEVLSPSSARDDKGAKFMQYQTIESLTDYLLIDSTEVAVLHYRKEGEIWTPRLFEQASDAVGLPGLGIELPLVEIYLDTGLLKG